MPPSNASGSRRLTRFWSRAFCCTPLSLSQTLCLSFLCFFLTSQHLFRPEFVSAKGGTLPDLTAARERGVNKPPHNWNAVNSRFLTIRHLHRCSEKPSPWPAVHSFSVNTLHVSSHYINIQNPRVLKSSKLSKMQNVSYWACMVAAPAVRKFSPRCISFRSLTYIRLIYN